MKWFERTKIIAHSSIWLNQIKALSQTIYFLSNYNKENSFFVLVSAVFWVISTRQDFFDIFKEYQIFLTANSKRKVLNWQENPFSQTDWAWSFDHSNEDSILKCWQKHSTFGWF